MRTLVLTLFVFLFISRNSFSETKTSGNAIYCNGNGTYDHEIFTYTGKILFSDNFSLSPVFEINFNLSSPDGITLNNIHQIYNVLPENKSIFNSRIICGTNPNSMCVFLKSVENEQIFFENLSSQKGSSLELYFNIPNLNNFFSRGYAVLNCKK